MTYLPGLDRWITGGWGQDNQVRRCPRCGRLLEDGAVECKCGWTKEDEER